MGLRATPEMTSKVLKKLITQLLVFNFHSGHSCKLFSSSRHSSEAFGLVFKISCGNIQRICNSRVSSLQTTHRITEGIRP